MIANRFAVPLADLEDGARVAVTEQVEEQAPWRLYAPLIAPLGVPFGDGMTGGDGDGD
ncbi:MAG: hypothetical protein M3486_04645 [Actinomycetota bacterium]|nr:hypothetical protein [Actinomycetota bacterium]